MTHMAQQHKQINNQLEDKSLHRRKFSSFLQKNNDAPYHVKYKVWQSALNTALFYASETWWTPDMRSLSATYMSCLKQMLSVRQTTCNDLVYVETGLSDARSMVIDKQALRNFLPL